MSDSRRPSDLADKMMMRLPPGMRDRIAEAAQTNGRSMNAEVVARLEKSFEDDSEAKAIADRVERLEEEVSSLYRSIEDLEGAVGRLQRR